MKVFYLMMVLFSSSKLQASELNMIQEALLLDADAQDEWDLMGKQKSKGVHSCPAFQQLDLAAEKLRSDFAKVWAEIKAHLQEDKLFLKNCNETKKGTVCSLKKERAAYYRNVSKQWKPFAEKKEASFRKMLADKNLSSGESYESDLMRLCPKWKDEFLWADNCVKQIAIIYKLMSSLTALADELGA